MLEQLFSTAHLASPIQQRPPFAKLIFSSNRSRPGCCSFTVCPPSSPPRMETKETCQESAPKGDPSTNRSPLASVRVGVGLDMIVWPNGKREKRAVCGGPTTLQAVVAANFHSFFRTMIEEIEEERTSSSPPANGGMWNRIQVKRHMKIGYNPPFLDGLFSLVRRNGPAGETLRQSGYTSTVSFKRILSLIPLTLLLNWSSSISGMFLREPHGAPGLPPVETL